MSDDLLDARLRLALVPGLGPILTRRLEERFESPLEILRAGAAELQEVEGISRKKAEMIRRGIDEADVEAEKRLMREWDVHAVTVDSEGYPPLLRHIPDPPPLLYVRGRLDRRDSLSLAIVGARRCTLYGREQADRLAALCGQAGLTIISGGALGIDSAAHRAALRVGARTIAVVGCGLARCYPPEHAELYQQIAAIHDDEEGESTSAGAVVSEYAMTAPPIAENFPRRNRIISGLSLGVLVVEASNRSGALITARLAAEEHHREVMALPGRVDSPLSAGCHKILREGWATLVTGPADIMDALGEAGQTLKAVMGQTATETVTITPVTSDNLSPDQQKVLAAITLEGTDLDDICMVSGMPIGAIQGHLTHLQLIGLVERLPANRVRRKR